jgi:hypothetical protein
MATYNAVERYTIEDSNLFASYPTKGFESVEFDFVVPSGNEDATINQLIIHDLLYESAPGKFRKLQVGGTLAEGARIGIVANIRDIEHNQYNSSNGASFTSGSVTYGRVFTQDEGVITIYTATYDDFPIFAKKAYLHNVTAGTDTRVPFDFATHGTGAGVLAGRVAQLNSSVDNPTFKFTN